jgi:hypothetical protein
MAWQDAEEADWLVFQPVISGIGFDLAIRLHGAGRGAEVARGGGQCTGFLLFIGGDGFVLLRR